VIRQRVLVQLYWRFDPNTVINYGVAHALRRFRLSIAFLPRPSPTCRLTFRSGQRPGSPTKVSLRIQSDCLFCHRQIPASLVVAAAKNNYHKAVYMASYRVTDMLVHAKGQRLSNPRGTGPLHREYLGIAFLRADLSIIRTLPWLHAAVFRWQDFRLSTWPKSCILPRTSLPRVDQCSANVPSLP
jgi:hypothetical protein